jgi:hypothetical protein
MAKTCVFLTVYPLAVPLKLKLCDERVNLVRRYIAAGQNGGLSAACV